jgi:hypothetical protein
MGDTFEEQFDGDPRTQELNVVGEKVRAVRCPACQTKYIFGKQRDRVRCFSCERVLIVGIETEDYQ